jgi:hypothetical protein
MKLRQAWEWVQAKPARMIVFAVATALLIVALIPTVITWAPHWLASTNGLEADSARLARPSLRPSRTWT